MKAFTRLGQYMILATIEGPLSMDGLQVHLKSDPPKDENTLKRFLTLKTDNADLTNNDWMGLIDAGIQLSYLSDVEDAIKQALQLDELRVYSGSLQSGIGFSVDAKRANEVIGDDRRQYNWLVAKSFGDKLRLGYTASFDGGRLEHLCGILPQPPPEPQRIRRRRKQGLVWCTVSYEVLKKSTALIDLGAWPIAPFRRKVAVGSRAMGSERPLPVWSPPPLTDRFPLLPFSELGAA